MTGAGLPVFSTSTRVSSSSALVDEARHGQQNPGPDGRRACAPTGVGLPGLATTHDRGRIGVGHLTDP
jgi:hypothetical protein